MNNLPVYNSYNGETEIALLDNSSVAFLEQMHHNGFQVEDLLRPYDAILVPGWVLEEVQCSSFRIQYLIDLHSAGLPIYSVNEEEMIGFADEDEVQMLHIVKAAVMNLGQLKSYIRKNVEPEDILDLEPYAEWISQMYQNWPIPGKVMANGNLKKKNAGEISLTVLAEVLAWNQPKINALTIYSQDADTRKFQTCANANLKDQFGRNPSVTVTYKSNDFIMCQMFREGKLSIDQVKHLRKDARHVLFTQKRPDESVALDERTLDNDEFVQLIADPHVQIIF